MSFEKNQFEGIITETLNKLGMHSESAVQLLMGTSAVESQLGYYIRQMGNGPARGVFQMEPATEKDIWLNYLRYKGKLGDLIFDVTGCGSPNPFHLEGNMLYQIAMTRVHYRRVSEALPQLNDGDGMANYWKKYYNTPLGAGTIEHFIKAFNKYCV